MTTAKPATSDPGSTVAPAPRRSAKRYWKVPAALIALSLVPVIAGAARITELSIGAEVTDANSRFFASPSPVVIHIVAASVYSVLGAFQFVPSLRRGRPGWHRMSGRLFVPLGLLAALSGVWMTLFYSHPDGENAPLFILRLFFGLGMATSICLGVRAIVRRDFAGHGEWMTRAYAIGLGAGTQVFTQLPWMLLAGTPDKPTVAVLMGLGWVINVAVAEYVIRHHRRTARGSSRRQRRSAETRSLL